MKNTWCKNLDLKLFLNICLSSRYTVNIKRSDTTYAPGSLVAKAAPHVGSARFLSRIGRLSYAQTVKEAGPDTRGL